MAAIPNDLIAEREATGADIFDEVWDGTYMIAPLPNDEHQQIANRLAYILMHLVGWPGLGDVRALTKLSDRDQGWEHNYRSPDVAVFLKTGKAKNHGTHWSGAADFLAEIISHDDKSREKLPFYGALGVKELLLVDRDPWALELFQLQSSQLELVARDTLEQPATISLAVVPLDLRLQTGEDRPSIEVVHRSTGDRWLV